MNSITCPHCSKPIAVRVDLIVGNAEIDPGPRVTVQPLEYRIIDAVSTLVRRSPRSVNTGSRRGIVIHHSGTAMKLKGSNPEAYARYHVEENKWPSIGYTMVIQFDGTIYRTLRDLEVGYHAGSAEIPGDENALYCGICFSGDFDKEDLPAAAFDAGVFAARALIVSLGLDPATAEILPHSHFSSKTCPGTRFPFINLCERIRKG